MAVKSLESPNKLLGLHVWNLHGGFSISNDGTQCNNFFVSNRPKNTNNFWNQRRFGGFFKNVLDP